MEKPMQTGLPAITTMLVRINTMKGRMIDLIFPTTAIRMVKNDKTGTYKLIFGRDLSEYKIHPKTKEVLMSEGELAQVVFDISNDPCPTYAGSVVSLGYYNFRVNVAYCKIESFAPFILSTGIRVKQELISMYETELKKAKARGDDETVAQLMHHAANVPKDEINFKFTRPQRPFYSTFEERFMAKIDQGLTQKIRMEAFKTVAKIKEVEKDGNDIG